MVEICDKICISYSPESYEELLSQKERKVYLYGNGKYAEMVWKELEKFNCTSIINGIFVSSEYRTARNIIKEHKVEIWDIEQVNENIDLIIGFNPVYH